MQQCSLDNARYYASAQESYLQMKQICNVIKKKGYYEEPEELLQLSIEECLDLFLQSVLISFCVQTNRFDTNSRKLLRQLPDHEMIPIAAEGKFSRQTVIMAEIAYQAPPVLLQLCQVYDEKEQTQLTSLFFDHVLSILLALANLDGRKDEEALKFLQEFYKRMMGFLHNNKENEILSKRYFFKKVSSEEIQSLGQLTNRSFIFKENPNLQELLDQLNHLTGLGKVKQQVMALVHLIEVRKIRKYYGMTNHPMTYHMVFTGNPGTGKTTVARLIAKLYKELGILKNDTFVETDRAGLVAGYVGQTALKVKEAVKRAEGGVLFIDEAYSLANGSAPNDYGREAVDALVKAMEDQRESLVVIVAGYPDEMQQFLKSNSGLISRFNTFIEFEDYSEEELLGILISFALECGMHLTTEAKEKVMRYLTDMTREDRMEFGNARGIRNLFERTLLNQADRLMAQKTLSKDDIAMLEACDFMI